MPTRREFLGITAGVVGGLVIGAAGTLLVRPSTANTTTEGGTGTVTQTVTATQTSSAVANLADLGTLFIGMNISGADSLDPAYTFDSDPTWIPLNNAYQQPFNWQYPEFRYVAPHLLTDLNVASDGVTWSGTVVSNATFATGDPITANDLVYSAQRVLNVGANGIGGFFFDYMNLDKPGNISAPNSSTFQFILDKAYTASLVQADITTLPWAIVNQKQTETHATTTTATSSSSTSSSSGASDQGQAWLNAGNSAGSGPFVITEWVANDHITLVRNENFWGSPKPKLQKVVIQHVANPNSELLLLQKGSIDVMWDPTPAQATTMQYSEGFTVLENLQPVAYNIYLNGNSAPFNNKDVCNAVKWSIDYNSLVDTVLGGSGEVLQTLSWLGLPYADASTPYSLNPTMAKQLLAGAGYPNGLSVNLVYQNTDNLWPLVAPVIQANLAQSGITATLVGVDLPTEDNYLTSSNFQMLAAWEGGGLSHIANAAWWTMDYRIGALAKWIGFNDPQALALIDATHDVSEADAPAAWSALTQYGQTHAPVVNLWQLDKQVIISSKVQGLVMPLSRLYLNLGLVYKQGVSGFS